MVFEEEKILKELKIKGRIAISRLGKLLKIPYYRLKFEYVPQLEKDGLIKVFYDNNYVYIELTERGLKEND